MNSKNVIELNGKRYDAVTGKCLGTAEITHTVAVRNTSQMAMAKPSDKKSVDGVLKASKSKTAAVDTPLKTGKTSAKPAAQRPKTARAVATHAPAHKPQSSSTLMRAAVAKPKAGFKQQATVQGSMQHSVPHIIAVKEAASSVNLGRLARAQSTPRSQHVSRYDAQQAHHIPVLVQSLAVQEPPVAPHNSGAPAPAPSNKPIDIFEHAIQNASHFRELPNHAHFKKRARKHFTTMTAGSLVLLFLAGFIAYQNVPGVQYRLASMKAGVSTDMPRLTNAGYVVKGVTTAPSGKLVVVFQNPTSSAQYRLTEQASNWTDSAMIANVAATDASGTPNYETLKANDTTVYRFANDLTTWVSHGTWYQLSSTAAITDQQVATIVKNS